MKKTISQKLREHLASISREEFQKEWTEIENLGLQSVSVEEFSSQLQANSPQLENMGLKLENNSFHFQQKSFPSNTTFHCNVIEPKVKKPECIDLLFYTGETNYAMSA